ncbi:MAG: alpha/beta fold hydrolase [Acidobacteriaceae bacterium]|nr:alpha/beta fold hydrolase [Acidobacteriaceae bacterium]
MLPIADREIETALLSLSNAAYYAPATFSNGPSSYALASKTSAYTAIAWRGTESGLYQNWISDLDAIPEYHPTLGWCHRGFLQAAIATYPQAVQQAVIAPLVLTGHSLGAAVAVLTAALLRAAHIQIIRCSVFGCPNFTLNQNISALMHDVPGYRWRDGNDPVPQVPPGFHIDRPTTQIGTDYPDPISAHMIDAYAAALNTVEWK